MSYAGGTTSVVKDDTEVNTEEITENKILCSRMYLEMETNNINYNNLNEYNKIEVPRISVERYRF